jgi:hypothetical protein
MVEFFSVFAGLVVGRAQEISVTIARLPRYEVRCCAMVLAIAGLSSSQIAAAAQPMTFYGSSLGQGASACGSSPPPATLTIVARNPGTTWTATQLASTPLGGGTIAAAYGTASMTLPAASQQIKVVTSDVAYVLINSSCNGSSGSLTYPAEDGIATVGSRFVLYNVYPAATWANTFIAAVSRAATVTISTTAGATVAGPQTIPARGAWQPTGLSVGTVYLVSSAGGDVVIGSGSVNGYALLGAADSRAASCQNDVARLFFGSIVGWDSGLGRQTGVAVFNDGAAATVTLTQLTGGSASYTINAAANGRTYSPALYPDAVYRFESTSPVSIWAGSPEPFNTIDDLGDDVSIAMPAYAAGSWRLRSRAQIGGWVFAATGTTVNVNGTARSVPASQTLSVDARTDVVLTSTTPFLFESTASNNQNDWGKWLRPLPPVDSDSDGVRDVTEAPTGGCQSVAVDSDADGLADFLDIDSDNDCIADSDAREANAARTNPALPAGAHCGGVTPVCGVPAGSTAGLCQACNGNYASGAARACPAASAPICAATGACVPCGSSYGSGAPNACSTPTAPVCLSNGTCAACNGDYASGTSAACSTATVPFCSGGQCLPCNGAYGSGAAQACKAAATPVCSIGACLACNGGYGTGRSLACQLASAPVCALVGANAGSCAPCNGDNGSGATAPCQTTHDPYCAASGGTCGTCSTNADCAGHVNGPVCNPSTGACGTTCFDDGDCKHGSEWCASRVCTAKTPNGQPVPNVPPVNGQCTPTNGARVCASEVCTAQDDTCGLKAGEPCAAPDGGLDGGANAKCQSGVCAPNGTCGACAGDVECGNASSGKVCDDQTKTCIDGCRGTGGNGCPNQQVCSSSSAAIGACAANPGADAGDAGATGDAGAGDDGGARTDASTSTDASADGSGGGSGAGEDDSGVFEGGGLSCSTGTAPGGSAAAASVLALLALAGAARRRPRR